MVNEIKKSHSFHILSSSIPTKTSSLTHPSLHGISSHYQLPNQTPHFPFSSSPVFFMKRMILDSPATGDDQNMKRVKQEDEVKETGFTNLDENLLFEVLKHADAKTLARAASVNKLWNKTAKDERLWELICTRHFANLGCATHQLRSVVLALGGFRRLHSLYLHQLPGAPPSSSKWNPLTRVMGPKAPAHWGRDEVHLSLSLLSVRYYEMMNTRDLTKQ